MAPCGVEPTPGLTQRKALLMARPVRIGCWLFPEPRLECCGPNLPMKHRLARTFLLAASRGFLAGCQTVDDRIKEKPEVFAKLDAVTQDKIKQGIIELGYTEDMVYLALGKPDQMRESVSAEGKATTWIYNTYYERYDGTRFAGYHRSVYYDPYIKAYRFYYRPVYADTYAQEKEERIRVSFKDGKATVIEQSK